MGKEFTDRLFGLRKRAATGAHDFDRLCANLGIEHRLTPPMPPQTNGMVERFNGRIEDVLQSHHFNSREDLEQTLMRYMHLYNTQLPQSALKAKTPVLELKEWYSREPELFRKQPYYLTGCDTYGAGNMDALKATLSGKIECIYHGPAEIKHAGTYYGKAGVMKFYDNANEHTEYLDFQPVQFIAQGNTVVVLGNEGNPPF